MTFKKIIGQLHLWLGLASGLVVFIVGITGCCYVFIDEIQHITQPWQHVEKQQKAYLLPSQVKSIAEKATHGKVASFVSYTPGYTTYVGLFDKDYSYGVYINPYNGNVQHIKNFKERHFDFFVFMLNGHINLWLPYQIGQPIEHAGILIFIFLLISGLVLWWPKKWNKANKDKSFKIKWNARFKRLNYDLHNVLGFYALLIALAIAITGSVYSYGWFARSLYWVSSGGTEHYPEYKSALSDTTIAGDYRQTAIDSLWLVHSRGNTSYGSSATFPKKKDDPIEIRINYSPDKLYKQDIFDYDQHTLKPVTGKGIYAGRYAKASAANKLARMNYDIHTGQIGGLPGKILAFFASLICASLPITGFYIWWGKRKKKKKKAKKADKSTSANGMVKSYKAQELIQ